MFTKEGATGNGTGEGCLIIDWGLDNFDIYLRNPNADVKWVIRDVRMGFKEAIETRGVNLIDIRL